MKEIKKKIKCCIDILNKELKTGNIPAIEYDSSDLYKTILKMLLIKTFQDYSCSLPTIEITSREYSPIDRKFRIFYPKSNTCLTIETELYSDNRLETLLVDNNPKVYKGTVGFYDMEELPLNVFAISKMLKALREKTPTLKLHKIKKDFSNIITNSTVFTLQDLTISLFNQEAKMTLKDKTLEIDLNLDYNKHFLLEKARVIAK
jgi:hypothetical protein